MTSTVADAELLPLPAYEQALADTRDERMAWWREARFGLFIHYGLYAIPGRCEQVLLHEAMDPAEYEALAKDFAPKPGCTREWCALAKKAGMRYAVLTTKHHDGFCLWDTEQTDYNSMQACGRDLVAEFVESCRAEGLKVGLYHSLLDVHHPDGAAAAYDPDARARFLTFVRDSLYELMTRYGKIDILWHDVPSPMKHAEGWESLAMNQMVRRLQPHIIINNRSHLKEDHDTPEYHLPKNRDMERDWEACMTLNGSFGGMFGAAEDTLRARDIVRLLGYAAANQGNILLNIGPEPDGSVPSESFAPLEATGRWLAANGVAAYGQLASGSTIWYTCSTGVLSVKGNKAYFWCHWHSAEQGFGGFVSRLKSVKLLADGRELPFTQTEHHVRIRDFPVTSPDPEAGVTIVEMEFDEEPTFTFRPLLKQLFV